MKTKPRPRLSPEDIVSSIDYRTIDVNNIDQEEIHAVGYYLEELNYVKTQLKNLKTELKLKNAIIKEQKSQIDTLKIAGDRLVELHGERQETAKEIRLSEREKVCDKLKLKLRERVVNMYPDIDGISYSRKVVEWHDLVPILDHIKRGGNE